jgi:hypothetical protein
MAAVACFARDPPPLFSQIRRARTKGLVRTGKFPGVRRL